jgi:hypothetical protein
MAMYMSFEELPGDDDEEISYQTFEVTYAEFMYWLDEADRVEIKWRVGDALCWFKLDKDEVRAHALTWAGGHADSPFADGPLTVGAEVEGDGAKVLTLLSRNSD